VIERVALSKTQDFNWSSCGFCDSARMDREGKFDMVVRKGKSLVVLGLNDYGMTKQLVLLETVAPVE
jgi:hypothetical protein